MEKLVRVGPEGLEDLADSHGWEVVVMGRWW